MAATRVWMKISFPKLRWRWRWQWRWRRPFTVFITRETKPVYNATRSFSFLVMKFRFSNYGQPLRAIYTYINTYIAAITGESSQLIAFEASWLAGWLAGWLTRWMHKLWWEHEWPPPPHHPYCRNQFQASAAKQSDAVEKCKKQPSGGKQKQNL